MAGWLTSQINSQASQPTSQPASQPASQPISQPIDQIAYQLASQPASQPASQLASTKSKGKRLARSPSPTSQPRQSRLRIASRGPEEPLDVQDLFESIEELDQPASQPANQLASQPAQSSQLSQSRWASQPNQAQQAPIDPNSLAKAHKDAIEPILAENEHLRTLIEYSRAKVPEKQLHGRQAAHFIKAAHRLAQAYLNKPSEKALMHFLLLPRILGLAAEKGPIRETLEHFPHIWPEPPRAQEPIEPNSQQQNRKSPIERATQLLEAGLISRATKALYDESALAPDTPANREALYQKHPIGQQTPFPRGNPTAGQPIQPEAILEAIQSTNRETAPGLSGWTQPLLERVCQRLGPDSETSPVLVLIRAIARGIQQGVGLGRHLLTASRLISLEKDTGGIRPIAVGDLVYRVAAKAILRTHFRPEMLLPNQLGVSNPGGTEPAIFLLEEAITGPNEYGFTHCSSIDAENAFNSQSRAQIGGSILTYAPVFFRAAKWAYNHTSVLVTDSGLVLASAEGIRQGDPFGPLFFSISIRQPLEEAQKELPNTRLVTFLDDIYALEKAQEPSGPQSPKALEVVSRILGQNGLRINQAKSSQQPIASLRETGLKALGTFIGPLAGRKAFLEAKSSQLSQILKSLANLPKQHALQLFRSSISQLIRHLLRQLNPEGLGLTWHTIDQQILAQVAKLAAREIGQIALPKQARILATIPIRNGGLGLPIHRPVAAGIYKAAKAMAASQIEAILSETGQSSLEQSSQQDQISQLSLIRQQIQPSEPPEHPTAQEVLKSFTQTSLARLTESLSAEEANIQLENTSYLSRQWLITLPTQKQLELTDIEISGALRSRLLIPIQPKGSQCKLCTKEFSIGHEDACRQANKRWIQRHDQINRAITKTLTCRPELEVKLEPQAAQLKDKKPDFSIYRAPSRYYYDTQVVAINKASGKAIAQNTLAEAATAKKAHHSQYGRFFHPLILSAHGLMEKSTTTVYRGLQQLLSPTESKWLDSRIGLVLTRARAAAAHSIEQARGRSCSNSPIPL